MCMCDSVCVSVTVCACVSVCMLMNLDIHLTFPLIWIKISAAVMFISIFLSILNIYDNVKIQEPVKTS